MRKYFVCALLVVALCCLGFSQAAPAAKPAAPAAEKATPATTAPAAKPMAKPMAKPAAKPTKYNVNTAKKTTLVKLGLDAATADKVIAGRPYKTTDELVSKQILTQDQYDKIKGKIKAAPPAKPKAKAKAKAMAPAATKPAPATTEKPKQP